MKDRRSDYERQAWPVRLYRWLRWMPLGYVKGSWWTARASLGVWELVLYVDRHCDEVEAKHGVEIDRSDYFWQIFWSPWQQAVARAQHSMGYSYDAADIFEELSEATEK